MTKIQEVDSTILIYCLKNYYLQKNIKKEICDRPKNQIVEELYKRIIIPLYILFISLIAASLIIKPKSDYYSKYHKLLIFLFGFLIIIFANVCTKFLGNSMMIDLSVTQIPICFVLLFYLIISVITKFKFNFL